MTQQAVSRASSAGEAGRRSRPVEAPSGKHARDENFPVASLLIARRHRPHVMAFYSFARAADDVADSPDLAPEEKLRRLDAFEAGLQPGGTGPAVAIQHRDSLAVTGVSNAHALALLAAFRLDAVKPRHGSWDELAAYCSLSAHPVGRFMLELHDEAEEARRPSDALTAALQVLNHLQDLKADYTTLDRIYLPTEWLADEGVPEGALAADAASPSLRRVIDRCLDGCDAWLGKADPLPRLIRDRRLAAEAAVILELARRLSAMLRRFDPLARRVEPGRRDFAAAFLTGGRRLIRGR